MPAKHFDEARRDAIDALRLLITEDAAIDRAVLIDDFFGRIRVVLWDTDATAGEHDRKLNERLDVAADRFWTREIWHAPGKNDADRLVYDRAWDESYPADEAGRLRVSDRRRTRNAWFRPISEPPWEAVGEKPGPPIVTFYSFKGGVGRTTALASFAIQRARLGERVVIVDLDLDAPGIGTLLAADEQGTIAPWGVVDYLLERPLGAGDFRDYYHACRRDPVTGRGEILVVPAGSMEPVRGYLEKLARLDFDYPGENPGQHPMDLLLRDIRSDLTPHWVLLDSRAGLSEPAGVLLGGFSHLHVILATGSEQGWYGLRLILDRIGASRVREEKPQLDCVLVQTMVPDDATTSAAAKAAFATRARDEFTNWYYAPDPADPDEDRLWYVRDAEASDAPHVPVPIPYMAKLSQFTRIEEVADFLAVSKEYQILADRVAQRFARQED